MVLLGCEPPVSQPVSSPKPITETSREIRIHSGFFNTYIIDAQDVLWGTGSNEGGRLGIGSFDNQNTFQKIMTDVQDVYGQTKTYVLKNDGSLWGAGLAPIGDGTNLRRPSLVKVFENVKTASFGVSVSALVTNTGDLYTWGDNSWGQLFNGETSGERTLLPTYVRGGVKEVVCVLDGIFVIDSNDDLWSAGNDNDGVLGNGAVGTTEVPTLILSNVAKVSATSGHAFALLNTGELYAWGNIGHGQSGDSSSLSYDSPTLFNLDNVVDFEAGDDHSVFLLANGDALTAGTGRDYRALTASESGVSVPTLVKKNVKDISTLGFGTILLTNDNAVWGAGSNTRGELGTGTFSTVQYPQVIWHDWW
jgi:alpha-tubulin suppressor-like RCC1 family protein